MKRGGEEREERKEGRGRGVRRERGKERRGRGEFTHFMVILMAGQREDPGRGAEDCCCCSPCSSLAGCGARTTSAG